MDKSYKRFVAYFDVLGYGKRVENIFIDEEYKIQNKVLEDLEVITKNSSINVINFSDTFILYPHEPGVSDTLFEGIIKSSLLLMLLLSIRKSPYLPVRGAIAFGDFLFDKEKNIIIGDALREACSLEKQQEWMGCCLSDSCYEAAKKGADKSFNWFKDNKVLVNYSVPFKTNRFLFFGKQTREMYVVNIESFSRLWGQETKNMPITQERFIENIFINKGINKKESLSLDKDAIIKLRNTQAFFKYVEKIKSRA